MKLSISLSRNPSLLKKFPRDPDCDVVVLCNHAKFKLQIAFLYIDSAFFEKANQDHHKEIDLGHLDEQALQKVLKVMYGGEVSITTFQALQAVYEVVEALQVDSLKAMILSQLREQIIDLNTIQMLEFAYRNNVLIPEISHLVFDNNLQILRDPQNSLDLNKISQKTLNRLLEVYYNRDNTDKLTARAYISGILSDYFHINRIIPEEYFKLDFPFLKDIWFQSHPLFLSQVGASQNQIQQQVNVDLDERPALKERIRQLEELMKRHDETLGRLKEENQKLKSKAALSFSGLSPQNRAVGKESAKPLSAHGLGQGLQPTYVPTRISYQMHDDEAFETSRKISSTNEIKTLHNIKSNPRNNSRGRI